MVSNLSSKQLEITQRRARKTVEKRATQLKQVKVIYQDRVTVMPNPYNPNRQSEHDFELLCRSMEEDGFTQPILVCREVDYTPTGGGDKVRLTNVIVDGEHRWRAAGVVFGEHSEIPIVFVSMNEEQMRISTFRHNRARGSEDLGLAAEVLRDLKSLGAIEWAQDSLIMDDVEMQALLDDDSAKDLVATQDFSSEWGKSSNLIETTQRLAGETRASQQKIEQDKLQEDRESSIRDANSFRISLIFSGKEAVVVKRVLATGSSPAAVFLEMCRAKTERTQNAPAT